MCNLDQHFILCTCAEEIDYDQPYWTLERVTPVENGKSPMELKIVGSWCPPKFSQEREDVQAFVLNELQRRNCFDQEFELRAGDQLRLFFSGQEMKFTYIDSGRWVEAFPSNPFMRKEGVRTLLGKGKVR